MKYKAGFFVEIEPPMDADEEVGRCAAILDFRFWMDDWSFALEVLFLTLGSMLNVRR